MPVIQQHNIEIHENRKAWESKPVLREVYADLYKLIAAQLAPAQGDTRNLELGSGMGNVKAFVPDCITSDIFTNPWLDRTENAYALSFADESLANLILFDVWHHLQYPANALAEAARVLRSGGRLLVMDPAMSLAGRFVYGLFHHEPLAFGVSFDPRPVPLPDVHGLPYFAAQSSATRLLVRREMPEMLQGWRMVSVTPVTSFAYLASGGFRGRQLYPDGFLPAMRLVDRVLGVFPSLFAARFLIVLEKK
jgi:SAM-dependent methyltransferase